MEKSEWIVAWSDGMGIGIPELDAADRRINALVHELNRAIADGRGKEEIQRLMDRLQLEAVGHFEHEEQVLAEYAYPNPAGHAALHLQIRAELEHAAEKLRNVEAHALRTEYGLLVAQLFVEHMRQESMKFRNFRRPDSLSGTQVS